MRKRLIIFILFLISGTGLTGQSVTDPFRISLAYPVYSQYLQNGLLINPAYAGSRDALSLFASFRKQWLGVDRAPTYQTLSMHSLLKNNHVALGLTLQTLQYGYTKGTSVYADYAYHVNIGRSKLSMGLKAGFDMANSDYSGINLIDGTDGAFAGSNKYFMPNVGAGVYFYNNKFFVGAAVPTFLSYEKSSVGKVSLGTFTQFDVQATAGVLIKFADVLKFKPSVFVDYSLDKTKNMRIDLNANFIICDLIWVGGSWRNSEKVAVGIFQVQVNPQMMFGFSYDYPVGAGSTYPKGSVEGSLRYEFGYKVSAANPRYF